MVVAENLRKGYGDRVLIDELNFRLPRGGIVGVIGPNGAGKTTLFRMIAGQETPDSGTLKIGDTVKIAYVDQSREDLVGDNTRMAGDLGRRRYDQARRPRDPVAGLRLAGSTSGGRISRSG